MPNAFTPNGDSHNDVFRIPPDTYLNLREFSIFNRWGNKIFTTTDITKGWDGYTNGLPCENGTYVYIITGTNDSGEISLKGTVILVR